jgi:aminoglycoside phosphotransferase (APT) family kinase protein
VLDQSEAVSYLLGRGLVDACSVVDGSVVVREVSSRNRNFAVDAGDAPSYLLKQGFGPEGAATVAHEAAVYQRLSVAGGVMEAYLPRFHGYDADERVLILELIREARDLGTYHRARRRFSTTLASAVGDALGRLQAEVLPAAGAMFSGRPPWVLSIHRPDLRIFRQASAASLELVKTVQSVPALGRRLDELRQAWRSSVLTHNDFRWENLLACPAAGSSRPVLKVIDWEAARRGDPCWDIGSAFSDYLSFWLFSIPVTGRDLPERFPELARSPLQRMHPALAACWQAYRRRAGLAEPESSERLRRAVSFAAARLIATAFEGAQMSARLDSSLILHLQLAVNILERPREAAVHLLGLQGGQT